LVWNEVEEELILAGFLRNEKCLNVKGLCTDLWAPYHKSVRTHLKNAVLVFDKFHVFKYLSDAIEKVRRIEQRNASKDGKALLKGSRWIILKNDLNKKQKRRLKELMENNKNISMAVMLKEDFAAFYEAPTKKKAEEILEEWTKECEESNLRPFKQLAKRLNRWKEGIL
jgi:transposase